MEHVKPLLSLLRQYEGLEVELRSSLKTHPGSEALNRPMHPSSYYPKPWQDDQHAAWNWRERLGETMGRWRKCFRDDFPQPDKLSWYNYPLATFGKGPGSAASNELYGFRAETLFLALNEHKQAL